MKRWLAGIWLVGLLGSGAATLGWQAHQAEALSPQIQETRSTVSASLLGSLRRVIANFTWISAYAAWERRDPAQTDVQVRAAVALAPETRFFWVNGARKMAYDFPRWEQLTFARQTGRAPTPAEVAALKAPHLTRAVAFLREAETFLGPTPQLAIERAMIHLHAAGDRAAAADAFHEAAQRPGAPYFAGRVYAELLRDLGRATEALAWYTETYPTLPVDEPSAARAVVAERIAQLRAELGLPPVALPE